MEGLSSEDILRALATVSEGLAVRRIACELVIGGGAALVILYAARRSTKDVDVLLVEPAGDRTVYDAAKETAEQLGLPPDWLNDAAKGYAHGILRGAEVFRSEWLIVRAAGVSQLFAMKLCAWRDDVDIEDARLLLKQMAGTKAEIWHGLEPYLVPGRELKASLAFDDLLESEHGDR